MGWEADCGRMRYNYSNIPGGALIRERPKESRPRELLVRNGAASLDDDELLCVLIGSGTKDCPVDVLARRVRDCLDAHPGAVGCSHKALCQEAGLGAAKAAAICAAMELGRRFNFGLRRQITEPRHVYPLVKHYASRPQEVFLAVLLNGAHEVFDIKVVTIGLVNRTLVHPREVFAYAVEARSCAVVLAHNHPSGNLEPSPDDLAVTREMVRAGEVLGIKVLDHLIFSEDGFISLADQGLVPG